MAGKGSGRRPTDEHKFQSNYDLIFGNKQKEKQDGNTPTSNEQTEYTDRTPEAAICG
jgi:hypothetical protein